MRKNKKEDDEDDDMDDMRMGLNESTMIKLSPQMILRNTLIAEADLFLRFSDYQQGSDVHRPLTFEQWYSRGHKSRPDVIDFQNGVSRCTEAINKAMGKSHSLLKHFIGGFDVEKLKKMIAFRKIEGKEEVSMHLHTNYFKPVVTQSKVRSDNPINHNLLEELYEDYVYLKELEKDPMFNEARNPKGLHDTRFSIIMQFLSYSVVEEVNQMNRFIVRKTKNLSHDKPAVLPKIQPLVAQKETKKSHEVIKGK
ncbi:hypothetical protein HDV02_001689 [Globomyces sp. JEL0801]|nr:hypothetical protein HDV02_001689 [Globomyces sp. JEL0801]